MVCESLEMVWIKVEIVSRVWRFRSQTILEVVMLDVEVLGWCCFMLSAVRCTVKFSETPLESADGRVTNI